MDEAQYPPVGDYGFISDCHSSALVARDGSIEWCCFHRFDASPVFARILDREIGGYFRIAPVGEATVTRRYLDGTNVLETRFETADGVVTVTDCMPFEGGPPRVEEGPHPDPEHLIVRVVRGVAGRVPTGLVLSPRFNYGMTTPRLAILADDLCGAWGGADSLVLESELGPLRRLRPGVCGAEAVVGEGDELVVALTHAPAAGYSPTRHERSDLLARVERTVRWWADWSARCIFEGRHREAVVRSALVLKGLTSIDTGAVVAAATTSLPEEVGGVRNWDYRYTWLRDSAMLSVALLYLGYEREATDFARWLERTTAGRAEELQIMYGTGGERLLPEASLEHLDGYRGSRPVRVGNGAAGQFQLDTYGEVVGVAALMEEAGADGLSDEFVEFLFEAVDVVVRRWEDPDEGIWEVRGPPQHFVFSKMMAWLALERGIWMARRRGLHDRVAAWEPVRAAIRARIESEGVHPDTGAFTQALGSTSLDASVLLAPIVGFLPYDDPRVLATIDYIDRELTRNGHVFRYLDRDDGLPGGEGTFFFCSAWLVNNLALSGQLEKAEERFEQLMACANDLGLLAEEVDPDTGEMLGNFPQAFSHIGVISAALAIELGRAAEAGE